MSAPRVTVYTLRRRGPCLWARDQMLRQGVPFNEVRGDDDPAFGQLLLECTGGLTVPQIGIGDVPIGADSLKRLDRPGLFPALLGDARFPLARIVRRLWLPRILESYLLGGTTGPWTYRVELVDQRGRVLERRGATSAEESSAIAAALGPAVSSGIALAATNGAGPGC